MELYTPETYKVPIMFTRTQEHNLRLTKFDRKKFTMENERHKRIVERLRVVGFLRACELRRRLETKFQYHNYPDKFWGVRSTAFEEARWQGESRKGVFLDAGCGLSPDTAIAKLTGFKEAYGIDLFPRRLRYQEHGVEQLQGDICEKIPIKSNSVDLMICQAVLPLMIQEDRLLFYKEAYRTLKHGGFVSVYFTHLRNGHPYHIPTEKNVAEKIGFILDKNYPSGFVLQKP